MSERPASELHIGCADLPPKLSRQQYFRRLAYLESRTTLTGIPRASALQRWRADAGEQGRFGLLAPQVITHRPGRRGYPGNKFGLTPDELLHAGGFRATAVVARAVDLLAEAAASVGADVIIFRSPPDFAPSSGNRDIMRAFFRDLAPAGRFGGAVRVWEPQGLWELEAAARFAGELGIVLACDPLSNDPLGVDPSFFENLPGDTAYFRVTGLGSARSRFDDYALEPLLAAAECYRQTWLVFAHEGKYPDAIRLRRQLQGEPPDADAAMDAP